VEVTLAGFTFVANDGDDEQGDGGHTKPWKTTRIGCGSLTLALSAASMISSPP
jgi:hypothetical protein